MTARSSRRSQPTIRRILGLLLLGGCVPLTDYDEVAKSLPEGRLLEVGGQRVHVERWGKTGSPLVLIHGMGSSTYGFHELGPLLGESHRVVAIDLNGFGFTERPKAEEAYTLEGQTKLILATMDALGIRRASVIGHSYGGYLAMRLAREHPERTDKVVLISPALDLDVAPPAFARSRLLRSMAYPALRVLVSSPRGLRKVLEQAYHRQEVLNAETVRQYQQRLLVEGLDRAYRGLGASIGRLSEERVELADLEAPVLVVAGRQDQVVPLEGLQRAMQVAPSNIGLTIVEDCGHSVPEEQAERLAQELRAFLGGG